MEIQFWILFLVQDKNMVNHKKIFEKIKQTIILLYNKFHNYNSK